MKWESAPGNVLLSAKMVGLPKDSVANVSQIVTLDRVLLSEYVGRLPEPILNLVLSGIDVVLGTLILIRNTTRKSQNDPN